MNKNQLFIEACKNGDIVKAEKLLKKSLFSKPADINSYTYYGYTALMFAAQNKHPQIVDFLIKKGADVNFGYSFESHAAIKLAIDYERGNDKVTLDIVTSLISAGANPNVNTDKKGPLLNAVLGEDPKNDPDGVYQSIALQLIKGGANINTLSSVGALTPIQQASEKGYVDVVKILLEKEANVNARNKNGDDTPLLLACYSGHARIVEMLIDKGADVNLGNSDRMTPLIVAAKCWDRPIVSMLIKKGALVDDETKKQVKKIEASEKLLETVNNILLDDLCSFMLSTDNAEACEIAIERFIITSNRRLPSYSMERVRKIITAVINLHKPVTETPGDFDLAGLFKQFGSGKDYLIFAKTDQNRVVVKEVYNSGDEYESTITRCGENTFKTAKEITYWH